MTATLLHRPAGSGHPYATTPDQRVPVLPLAGQPLWLGLLAPEEATAVSLEFEHDGRRETVAATRQGSERQAGDRAAAAGGEGHLAEAQAASSRTDGPAWQALVDELRPGAAYRYRFTADSAAGQLTTDWHEFRAAWWAAAGDCPQGRLTVHDNGSGGAAPGAETDSGSGVGPGLEADAEATAGRAGGPQAVQWLTDGIRAHRVRFGLRLDPDEHVVGLGERYDAVDQRGLTPDSVVFEQYKSQGRHHRTYFPMPFAHVVGGAGWGFHVDTSRRVWFDVARSEPDQLLVEAEVGADQALTVELYHGHPGQVLSGFLSQVGRAEPLPDWVHRLWASGNEWNTQAEVMAQLEAHLEHGVPVGVIVIEAWSDEETIACFRDAQSQIRPDGRPPVGSDFTYPADGAWPDPKGMVEQLHDRDIKLVLWQIPLLKSEATFEAEDQPHSPQAIADGQAMVRAGLALKEADGQPYHNRAWWFPQALMPDLSTPAGRDWWVERQRYLVTDLDIDGFKTDGGEHAWGHDLRYNDGSRGDEGNNRNPVHYARAYGDLLRSCGKAPVTFSRAGFTGSQAHGAFWAGDDDSTWEAFRASIRAGVTAGACGVVYWGWDLAGFSGPVPTPELYIRAAAASVFMPIMQYHSEFNHHRRPARDRTPWNLADQTGDRDVIVDFRRLVELRERLVGYLAEQARRAISTDRPLMRGLFFDWPDDPLIWEHPLQYALGDALLVNPVSAEGAQTWTTYLPAGDWIDVWTGTVWPGGRTVSTAVENRTVIPVFCRSEHWPELSDRFAAWTGSRSAAGAVVA